MSELSVLLHDVPTIDPAADAIEFDGKWYSWARLAGTIGEVRAALAEMKLGRDARVGILMRSRPSAFAAVLAVVAGDACMVSINPLLPDERLATDLLALALPVVIGESADLARPSVRDAIRASGSALIELPGILDGAALLAPSASPPAGMRLTEPGVIVEMLTSGTTGAPKRVSLKRDAFERSFAAALSYEKGRRASDTARLRPGTTILSGPMSHIGGLWGALTCIAGGRKACLLERFTVAGWRDAVVRHRPKVAGTVPAGLRMILDADIPREDLASLSAIRTGAAPLDPAIVAEFWTRYRIPVLSNYGATEFSGAVAGWTMKDFAAFHASKTESVGRFQPGVIGRVIDPGNGEEVSAGIEGVLEMRSEQFGNGGAWLRTTDRAVIDADGFLFIRGRADLAINRGGFKVHPDDVNKALESHPAVREAVTVGIADRRLGAVPVTAVMLKAGVASPSEEDFADFARAHLLPYQVPSKILVVDEVPRTESMKPALTEVRKLFVAGLDAA
ncbi:class I adenylate-forming enzyme family protein [Sphingomonas bacterium]|uniref:class I adenylate-forming enzyme family protein n=1 Tax=Sphingomonas bacterium TaxID=1895847 RepID=UPI0015768B9E|nr:fatty acid--CoA ligase family protein [Sphingomonas bacterium]